MNSKYYPIIFQKKTYHIYESSFSPNKNNSDSIKLPTNKLEVLCMDNKNQNQNNKNSINRNKTDSELMKLTPSNKDKSDMKQIMQFFNPI